jgi:hypothetical protein
MFRAIRLLGLFVVVIASASSARGYGPFNHLCVVDRNWSAIYAQIKAVGPLDESKAVDAVFAGAIADDLGYYPLNSSLKDLTNQTHYIRTGEWVDFLLRSARNQNSSSRALDYAFALGVLSHYAVDRMGHYYGTNVVAVRLAHEELLFGPRMSYERDPGTHKNVEAGFDLISLSADCRADKLSDRFYAFLQEPEWPDGEQVFGFFVRALRQFYGYSPVEKVVDLTHAVIFARRYTTRLLKQKEAGPYAWDRIASNQSATAQPKPGVYATQTPAEITEQDKWIEQQIKLGMDFRDVAQTSGFLPTFAGSFDKAQRLLLTLIESAAKLRGRQDEEVKSGQTLEMDRDTFLNVNLDTNQLSVSGRYDLADCTAEHLIAKSNARSGSQISYPPKTGELAPFFAVGQSARATLDVAASADDGILQTQLKKVADALMREHQLTQNALAPDASWNNVKFVLQNFPAAGGCPKDSNTIPFGSGRNICVGPKVIYWQGKVRALSLLFAASAGARLASVQTGTAEKAGPDRELAERREAIESFRLCDTNKTGGHLDAPSCKDGEPTLGNASASQACVNQD